MGLGPPVIALYQQLKAFGLFDNVRSVMELGSQNVWCPNATLLTTLFESFNRSRPSDQLIQRFADRTGSARDLYEGLGFTYNCVDTNGQFGALRLDINFDPVPIEHHEQYDLVTNHGTTEHVINQLNSFKMIHDFARPGGYMLHALPFLGQVNHGFFNYQPNLFDSLARYNSYRTLGMWIGLDWNLSSFIPWEPHLLDFLVLSPKSTGLLIVLIQKMHRTEFQIPFQETFELSTVNDFRSRYNFIVDGQVYGGQRDRFLTNRSNPASFQLSNVKGHDLVAELKRRITRRFQRLILKCSGLADGDDSADTRMIKR